MSKELSELEDWFRRWYEHSWNDPEAEACEDIVEVKAILSRMKKSHPVDSEEINCVVCLHDDEIDRLDRDTYKELIVCQQCLNHLLDVETGLKDTVDDMVRVERERILNGVQEINRVELVDVNGQWVDVSNAEQDYLERDDVLSLILGDRRGVYIKQEKGAGDSPPPEDSARPLGKASVSKKRGDGR